jgi:putative DNA methylase
MTTYPKRLIEVDLPIRRISAHARREKSIRHGHISTLHIWWARRPLAACRAVICASLWPDPADPLCPAAFITEARKALQEWTSHERQALLSEESRPRFAKARIEKSLFDAPVQLRGALLDFIADFANWDNSTVPEFLDTSRALTQTAHEALGGVPGTRPLVVDPFAGGGSIPLEALRVGADAFASDLNPIPVLLNKVVLEYIPKYGQRLADEVRKWGEWIKQEAEKELAEFYPKDEDGATPIAYLWARTIKCEGPGCGAEVPLIRSLWLAKKANRAVALQLVPNERAKRVDFKIIVKRPDGWMNQDNDEETIDAPRFDGTVKRGSATCPSCGYTTPVAHVRVQLKARRGGANDARLLCVVAIRSDGEGRFYRLPSALDLQAVNKASSRLTERSLESHGSISLLPEEPTPLGGGSGAGRAFSQRNYGMDLFVDLFTTRQLLTLSFLTEWVAHVGSKLSSSGDPAFAEAVQAILGLGVSRFTDICNALCMWETSKTQVRHAFTRQAIPMLWDFAEANATADAAGNYSVTLATMVRFLEYNSFSCEQGHVEQANAAKHPLPDDSVSAFVTDPPYYDAVPYSDLSDFFYVWLKRTLPQSLRAAFTDELTPKAEECIVDEVKSKDAAYFEATMKRAMAEGRRVLAPHGIGVVVFAHKSTAGWEAQLQAMIEAGWIMTGSWPIDTELGNRLRAMDSAALASSVHIVCRPRESPDGSVRADEVGDWSDVLQELPRRIHEWMPRLAEEGVVGADAIFACLGPALEIFSRYSRVEKASGEQVTLKDYLEHVWAAVSKEALSVIFAGANTDGFEPDARLTAMWLWTLAGPAKAAGADDAGDDEGSDEDEDGKSSGKGVKKGGFALEYDAARKIAQGLGAQLEDLRQMVEVSGDTARLLPVAERTAYLFGKEQAEEVTIGKRRRKAAVQPDLFAELNEPGVTEQTWSEKTVTKIGQTTLDRVHQSMILFAASRSEALKRFLVDDGAGNDPKFWRLANALSALYPAKSEEKRWVDGVLARKKGLGF